MIDTIVNDAIASVASAFHSANMMTLIFFAISAILVGIRCNSVAHIFDHALEALLITAILYSVYTIAIPDMPNNLDGWSRALAGKWNILMDFSIQRVLGYYLLMLTSIAFVFGIRGLLTRR